MNPFDPAPHRLPGPRSVRLLFDEAHQESWTVSRERAREINPADAINSSYAFAAETLASREYQLFRNLDSPLTSTYLNRTDLLILLHPCNPAWEKTTGVGSPHFSNEEIQAIQSFVRRGGSLLLITEYEHEKYGDNLNELLFPFHLQIENTTVLDREHRIHSNHAWILGEFSKSPEGVALGHGVTEVAFYQAGTCQVSEASQAVVQSHSSAVPPQAALLAVAYAEKGRVAVVTDSRLFGDEFFNELDHRALWLNLIAWLSVPTLQHYQEPLPDHSTQTVPAWLELKKTVNAFRSLQKSDGSVESTDQAEASALLDLILKSWNALLPRFPHEAAYGAALVNDFETWRSHGFPKPDFHSSLQSFRPDLHRIDQMEHLSLFPMYTPNGSSEIRLEAILFRTPWPDWLALMEKTRFPNPKFVPGELIDYTDGYASECAVLFPETVSISGRPQNSFGTIFCDREASRLLRYANAAVEATSLSLFPRLEGFLHSPTLAHHAVVLWDLIHDQAHSLGELPFDPFMIRQRAPYWMYSLEELRVDLRAFGEAHRLAQSDFPFAEYVTHAILLDRLFRFPIVGTRVRNYDGLGGQLLFAFLHQHEVLQWCDNRLTIDWVALPSAIAQLRDEITGLYRRGADSSKMAFWLEAHDLISRSVHPNVASKWKKETRAIENETDTAHWLSLIQEDEFPLGQFHLLLQKKILPLVGRVR